VGTLASKQSKLGYKKSILPTNETIKNTVMASSKLTTEVTASFLTTKRDFIMHTPYRQEGFAPFKPKKHVSIVVAQNRGGRTALHLHLDTLLFGFQGRLKMQHTYQISDAMRH